MVKLSYYKAVGQDDANHLLYGSSKKQIHLIGDAEGIGPFKEVQELALGEIKSEYDEDTFAKSREQYRNLVGKSKAVKVEAKEEETETEEESEEDD